jgi:hypothetical protein
MNCRDGEGGRLFVFMVQFVEVLVQERRMVDAVQPVRNIVLRKITEFRLMLERFQQSAINY